ncbi:MAG: lysylphosphatidylglycerol synthase transmembrane domain-containing protein [Planctomycetota bacterium]
MSGSSCSATRKRALFAVKLVVSLGLLAFVLTRADIGAVWSRMREADPMLMGLALLTPFLGYGITSIRWGGLLAAAGYRVRLGLLYRACMTAVFFNQLLPSTIGGDVARVYAAWKAGAPKQTALASLMVDRVVGVLAQVLLAAAMMPILGTAELPAVAYFIVGGLAVALAAVVLAVFLPTSLFARLVIGALARIPGPFAKIATKLEEGFAPYRGRWAVLARTIAISLLMIGNVVLMHWLIGRALGLELSMTVYFFAIPLATIVMLVPVSINGIGIREGIFALLLGAYGVGEADAVALSLLAFATFLTHGVLGGVVFATGRASTGEMQEVPSGADEPRPHAAAEAGA